MSETCKVKFETTKGDFVIQITKDWAPLGVERFLSLINGGYYDGAKFFRIVPGFVVQFGLAADPQVTRSMGSASIQDDPVKASNTKGTITFATAGPNTRTTQLFINFGNNTGLDRQGFSPFGKVIEGMDVVDKINAEYGESPNQGAIQMKGNAYLKKDFPNLDYIKSATILPAAGGK